jgi:hypothetical protein
MFFNDFVDIYRVLGIFLILGGNFIAVSKKNSLLKVISITKLT